MKLIHIENKFDPGELADVLRRERLDTAFFVLRRVKQESIKSGEPWKYRDIIEDMCRYYAINPNAI